MMHQLGKHELHTGDCITIMDTMEPDSFHAVVTDPPYGLGFQGRRWDQLPPGDDFARAAFRVCKPGAHIVAFGGTRTIHRLSCALEDAGFELRDMLGWVYYSGFPKSLSLRDQGPKWSGYGTALKPSYEPAILARKPLDGTVAQNVQRHGCGALNIDACRYMPGDPAWVGPSGYGDETGHKLGRWPANLYATAKPSTAEREAGCQDLVQVPAGQMTDRAEGSAGLGNPRAGAGRTSMGRGNHHPTVKPLTLMCWLVKLLAPPDGGRILEPFAGSGTTLAACELSGTGARCTAIELDKQYARIIRARYGGLDAMKAILRGCTSPADQQAARDQLGLFQGASDD